MLSQALHSTAERQDHGGSLYLCNVDVVSKGDRDAKAAGQLHNFMCELRCGQWALPVRLWAVGQQLVLSRVLATILLPAHTQRVGPALLCKHRLMPLEILGTIHSYMKTARDVWLAFWGAEAAHKIT